MLCLEIFIFQSFIPDEISYCENTFIPHDSGIVCVVSNLVLKACK